MRRRYVMMLFAIVFVVVSAGCNRAVRDGLSIGLTEGLTGGVSQVIDDFINALADPAIAAVAPAADGE